MEKQTSKSILGLEAILIIIFTILIAILLVAGIYLWQKNKTEIQIVELQEKIIILETQFNQIKNEKEQLQQDKEALQQEIEELTKKEEKYIRVISPEGGENLCLGDSFNIEWESKGVDVIEIGVSYGRGTNGVATVSATNKETGEEGEGVYVWKVGKTRGSTLEESSGYKIIMEGNGVSGSSKPFSIIRCQG